MLISLGVIINPILGYVITAQVIEVAQVKSGLLIVTLFSVVQILLWCVEATVVLAYKLATHSLE